MDKQNSEQNDLTFEQAYEQLNQIVDQLEKGAMPLQQAMQTYEKGIALAAYCEKLLSDAQIKITRLSESPEKRNEEITV